MSTIPFPGGTLHTADVPRLRTQLERVRHLMRDGQWRKLSQIRDYAGGSESAVSARLRDLRRPEHGGFTIEHRRLDGGSWEYRLLEPAGQQRLAF